MEKTILPNGLRLILAPNPGVAATAMILVAAGSEYEKKRVNGVSHFLEHMVFKGTKTRPTAAEITETLDGLGAEYNAFTGQEYTGYWAKAESSKVIDLLDLVSDLYLHPVFDPKEVEKERGVIIEEINMYEDMPMRRIHAAWMELLYGDQPAGWLVSGTKQSVRATTRADIVRYRVAHYVPQKTIVVVAGNFNREAVGAFVTERFGGLPSGKFVAKSRTRERQTGPRVLARYHKSDQIHVALGVRTFPVTDRRRYAAELLAHILGGGMSSRLFKRIREELGAAYYVRAEADASLDRGYFAVGAGVTPAKLETSLKAILVELERMKHEPVPAGELRRVKDHFLGTFMLGLETSDELANFYGDEELFTGSPEAPDAFAARIEAVTADDLMSLAREIFLTKNLNLALVGPVRAAAGFKKMLKFKG